jgi:hypothetical protein
MTFQNRSYVVRSSRPPLNVKVIHLACKLEIHLPFTMALPWYHQELLLLTISCFDYNRLSSHINYKILSLPPRVQNQEKLRISGIVCPQDVAVA